MTRVSALGMLLVGLACVRAASAAFEVEARSGRQPLRVEVREGRRFVELRVRVPHDADASSVELQLSGRTVTISARESRSGRLAYERRLLLSTPVQETGVTAESEGSDWLRIVLPRAPHAP